MEISAVMQLYERSAKNPSLLYNPFIGDSDGSVHRELCKINVYGPTKLTPDEEEIRHTAKRMGSPLQSIVGHYKCNRMTLINLIFGDVNTA